MCQPLLHRRGEHGEHRHTTDEVQAFGCQAVSSIRRSPASPAKPASVTVSPTIANPRRSPTSSISSGMTRAPTAIPTVNRLSNAPKTRPITSAGATRWTIVKALTSTIELASPMRNIATRVVASDGRATISSSGAAHRITPNPKWRAKR